MNQLAFSPLGTPDEERMEVIKNITPHVDRVHWDFMDNSYVPYAGLPISELNEEILKQKPIDVHFMVDNPIKYLEPLKNTSNDTIGYVVGQVEMVDDPREFIEECRAFGFRPGLAIHPETNVSLIDPFIMDCDCILVLGVIPGKSGQSLIPHTVDTAHYIRENRDDLDIIFDGGANPDNSKTIIEKGANIVVSGGFLQRTEDPQYAREQML